MSVLASSTVAASLNRAQPSSRDRPLHHLPKVRRSRSSPERGIAYLSVAVVNQNKTIVQRGSDTYLVSTRPGMPDRDSVPASSGHKGQRYPGPMT
jgi:hypothetical protein